MLKHLSSILIILIISFYSCKKDEDETPPRISFISPSENTSYDILEEVEVRASITDNKIIKSVELSLISIENSNKVMNSVFFKPNTSTFELLDIFNLDDTLLKGGDYYFKIEAKDEENSHSSQW